jgi:uncharacterized Tic20 family protein
MNDPNDIPPPPPPAPYAPPAVDPLPQSVAPVAGLSSDDRMWGMLAHLSALSGWFTGIGHIAGPLIVYLVKKDSQPFAAAEAKEALNFNISYTLYIVGLLILGLPLLLIGIGILLLLMIPVVGIAMSVLAIVAGLKANEGRPFRYPLTIRFVQ